MAGRAASKNPQCRENSLCWNLCFRKKGKVCTSMFRKGPVCGGWALVVSEYAWKLQFQMEQRCVDPRKARTVDGAFQCCRFFFLVGVWSGPCGLDGQCVSLGLFAMFFSERCNIERRIPPYGFFGSFHFGCGARSVYVRTRFRHKLFSQGRAKYLFFRPAWVWTPREQTKR